MAAKNDAGSSSADREIVITRVLNAPRELVFDAWIDPRHIANWWGPRGFTTTTDVMDVRPGGIWKYTMHGPDGTDYPNLIVYTEVQRPSRLTYSHGGSDEGSNDATFEATITFEDLGDKTRLTMRSIFPTAAARNHVVEKYRAVEGGNQTIDRLAEHLAKMQST